MSVGECACTPEQFAMPSARGDQHCPRLVFEHPSSEVSSCPAVGADDSYRTACAPRTGQDFAQRDRHAVIREESAFNPRIESFANAIGLTQMLVRTAKRFAGTTNVTREALIDPAKNLEVGSRFLSFLWKRFNGAAPLAIAGYNAGEGAVDRYQGVPPYDETRRYVERVLGWYYRYLEDAGAARLE